MIKKRLYVVKTSIASYWIIGETFSDAIDLFNEMKIMNKTITEIKLFSEEIWDVEN